MILLLTAACARTCAQDYIYPVASSVDAQGNTNLYLIYQHAQQLELLIWDPITERAHQALPSPFSPVYVRMIPDGTGFSFIDNGRIRIKKLTKRSAYTLDLYEPLYDITMVEWIDSFSLYICAKKKDKFSIFQLSVNGDVDTIMADECADCMYPCKVASTLFYIERSENAGLYQYKIMQMPYRVISYDTTATFNNTETFEMRSDKFIKNNGLYMTDSTLYTPSKNNQLVADFGNRPIIFLHMISESEGFVIEHATQRDVQASTVPLVYHHLKKSAEGWSCKPIFSFSIPTELITGLSDARLYESLLPLLPRYCDGTLLYNDTQYGRMAIVEYTLATETLRSHTDTSLEQRIFVPFSVGIQSWYGGSLSYSRQSFDDVSLNNKVPSLYYDDVGMRVCLGILRMSNE